jgi:nucleotidyltransferase substrate binding protein (TIGR01987 family)
VDRLNWRLQQAARAFASFKQLAFIESPSLVERDAAIQRFEYTTEACWKAAQAALLEYFGVEAASPKAVIRAVAQNGLLSEPDARAAMGLIDDRNLTSHTYNEALAITLFARLPRHADILEQLLKGLEKASR